ncbi:hypothetical protein V22_38390 [Calycomorphotria hydatis]|uniref:Uncharacterized protein n=1 Tax=Calycomorphotria hydatis TaxID=2528027 RepID=A0A517TDX2_9PLAN|nr:hypothetical protein V22_38390 [Calycomorphotria hydatis]
MNQKGETAAATGRERVDYLGLPQYFSPPRFRSGLLFGENLRAPPLIRRAGRVSVPLVRWRVQTAAATEMERTGRGVMLISIGPLDVSRGCCLVARVPLVTDGYREPQRSNGQLTLAARRDNDVSGQEASYIFARD